MADPFTLQALGDDPLGVLTSTAPVVEGAAHVRIDIEAIARFASERGGRATPPGLAEDALHANFLPVGRRLNYLLALEALNFCFWDESPRWRVPYAGGLHGGLHDGYWALAAALHRALREDAVPVWDAAWLATVDHDSVAHLLRGEGRPVPLLAERVENLREAGAVLERDWGGSFAEMVRAADGSAPELVRLIVEAFPSFRDEAQWRGGAVVHPVRFYKRAQICAADLTRLLAGEPAGRLSGLRHLTAFADYKVPQVLRGLGMLLPSADLAARIDAGEELPAGCGQEVELRAATVWACEWLARALNRQLAAGQSGGLAAVTPMDVDYLLWAEGQHNQQRLPPYHRTRTIYY